jgi:hypothetical protein
MKMLNWSDKLLDRVEAALDHAGWLGKTADAVLARLLPNDLAQASCTPCWCRSCDPPSWGYYCTPSGGAPCSQFVSGPCPDGMPC